MKTYKGKIILISGYVPHLQYIEEGLFNEDVIETLKRNIGKDIVYGTPDASVNLKFYSIIKLELVEDKEYDKK